MSQRLLIVQGPEPLADAFDRAVTSRPDTVLLDLESTEGQAGGLAAVEQLRSMLPEVRIVVLTADVTFALMEAAAEAGADLVMSKEAPMEDLATVIDGDRPRLEIDLRDGRDGRDGRAADAGLTPRELEVLRLLADGRTPKAIARVLGISVNTTRGHIKRVLWKLGEHSQLAAVAAATRRGILQPSVDRAG